MDKFHTKTSLSKLKPKLPSFSRPVQGNLQARKRLEALKIVSDSTSCSGYSTDEEEDSFSYKLRSGVRRRSEAPMKKLLAEELSKEMEVKRRPPSVIGRLMGLDSLPQQQLPVKKQEKKFSENYLKKTASIGYIDKRSSSERRSGEEEEFKDVYEVLESTTKRCSDKWIKERMKSERKMEYVRQKFLDVKRLSTDEKLQQSKEFHDALDVLDSNKDLLLRFLQEPDSLFTKHLNDLHSVPCRPQLDHRTVLQSSNEGGNICKKTDRYAEQNDRKQAAISHSRRKNVYIPSKDQKSRAHGKEGTCPVPTRIVVLKPNFKRVQNTEIMLSSPDSLRGVPSGYGRNREFGSSESLELFEQVQRQRDSSFEVELMRHRTQGSRDLAKEITRQMRHSVSSGSKKVPTSRRRAYAGDDSSYSLSENDSSNEFERKTSTSRRLSDRKSRCSPSSSYSTESSVSKEAKKRLSERWKMTHGFQELGKVSRGSTLGEMLAMPDKETSLTTSDSKVLPDAFSNRLSRDGVTRCASPLGISSRDGWKDECVRSLPRSRSLPASSTCLNSPKARIRYGFGKDRCSMQKEFVDWHSSNSEKADTEKRIGFISRSNTKSSCKRSPPSCSAGGENYTGYDLDPKLNEEGCSGGQKSHPLQNRDFKPDELGVDFVGVDLCERRSATLDIVCDDSAETTKSVDIQELSAHNSNLEATPISSMEESLMFSHCTITGLESPPSSKEAGQPSPVSVLEPPFAEEFSSSSDSFEKISADLHGLRKQLQLLKLESSDAYSEGSEMVVSSDEDIREGSQGLPGEDRGLNRMIREDVNKEFSYVIDMLIDSGFHDADLDVMLETWYAPELPAAPSLFDKLEKKKYGEQTLWTRSDRKLLFDRINVGLMELLRPHMDPHPWVKQESTVGPQLNGGHLAEELWKLMVRQDKVGTDCALMSEMRWLDLGGEVNAIGNEIVRLLFDDLVAEVVSALVPTRGFINF